MKRLELTVLFLLVAIPFAQAETDKLSQFGYSAFPSSIMADGKATSWITVTLFDGRTKPVKGCIVKLKASGKAKLGSDEIKAGDDGSVKTTLTCDNKDGEIATIEISATLPPLGDKDLVYVDPHGEKYHRAICRYVDSPHLPSSYVKKDLMAKYHDKYTACVICKPDDTIDAKEKPHLTIRCDKPYQLAVAGIVFLHR